MEIQQGSPTRVTRIPAGLVQRLAPRGENEKQVESGSRPMISATLLLFNPAPSALGIPLSSYLKPNVLSGKKAVLQLFTF